MFINPFLINNYSRVGGVKSMGKKYQAALGLSADLTHSKEGRSRVRLASRLQPKAKGNQDIADAQKEAILKAGSASLNLLD
jgi:hypothetical protein